MKPSCKRTVLVVFTCTAILLAAHASAQVTTYLNALHAEVTNRLASTNLTAAQERALTSANRTLSRDASSMQAELGQLAIAANTLNKRFEDEFLDEENTALNDYLYEATNQLADIQSAIGTNEVSRSVSKSLAKAGSAIETASDTSNSVPVRARALAKSLTKLDVAAMQVLRSIGLAPASLERWANLDFDENAIVNDQTTYDFHIPSGTFKSDNPEELGLWSYHRTGPSSAILTVMPNYPSNDVPRDFQLTFTNFSSGSFSGTSQTREAIQGRFFLSR